MGNCKSAMAALAIHDDNKNTIDDTVTSDIDSVKGIVALNQVEVLENDTKSTEIEEPNPMKTMYGSDSVPTMQESLKRLTYRNQIENVEVPIDDDDLHRSSSGECSYFCDDDLTDSVDSFHNYLSDDSSIFSSDWSSVSDREFQFDFDDDQSLESEKFVCRPSHHGLNNDENSIGSDNTWSVWGVDTMTKFWNGTRSKIVEPSIMEDRGDPDDGKDRNKPTRRFEGYEYWYNNGSYGTRQPLTAIFGVEGAVRTMQSARFLDNPRLEFLIVQKLLRNAKDDEVEISILMNLNKKGLLKKSIIYDCVENALHEMPSRLEATFRLLVELHPQVLKQRPLFHTFLLHCYTRSEHPDIYWRRFLTLLTLGLHHYPEDLGFLFHKDYKCSLSILPNCSSPFEMSCVVFGRERVIKAVGNIITKRVQMVSDPDVVATWVIAATTKENITLEALYFLLRREPTSTLHSLQFALQNT